MPTRQVAINEIIKLFQEEKEMLFTELDDAMFEHQPGHMKISSYKYEDIRKRYLKL